MKSTQPACLPLLLSLSDLRLILIKCIQSLCNSTRQVTESTPHSQSDLTKNETKENSARIIIHFLSTDQQSGSLDGLC